MPDFRLQPSFPVGTVIDASQKKAQLEQQFKTQNAELFNQSMEKIGQIGQSLVDQKKRIAQSLALGKQFDIPDDVAKTMEPAQILQVGSIKKGGIPLEMLRGLLSGVPPAAMTSNAMQPASAAPSQANGAMLTSNTTTTPMPDTPLTPGTTNSAPVPVPIPAPPIKPQMVNPATANLAMKMMAARQPEHFQTAEEIRANGGIAPHGTHVLPSEKGPQDIMDPKYQGKLEKDYTNMKLKVLSNRSGGLGLENQKVDQAIHLRKAINEYYDKKTGEYNIPPSLHSEFVMGLARLMSPGGVVAQQTMDDLRQRTAREGAANVLISMGFDPKQVGGTTQSVAKFFVEQIDRQGQTSEENRNGYMDYLRGQAPIDLDPSRIAKHDKVGLNSFSDLLQKSPDRKAAGDQVPGNGSWNQSKEQRYQMLLEKQKSGSLKS